MDQRMKRMISFISRGRKKPTAVRMIYFNAFRFVTGKMQTGGRLGAPWGYTHSWVRNLAVRCHLWHWLILVILESDNVKYQIQACAWKFLKQNLCEKLQRIWVHAKQLNRCQGSVSRKVKIIRKKKFSEGELKCLLYGIAWQILTLLEIRGAVIYVFILFY